MLTLRLPASLAALEIVADYAAGLAAVAGFTERDSYRLRLILDELVTNVATHGAADGGDPGQIELTGSATPGWVVLELVDHLRRFDPVGYQPPRTGAGTEPGIPGRLGGYGLVLVRRAADALEYHRTGDANCTTVLVVRERPGAADAGGTAGRLP
jgi:anti-sigma regulatory factor (Ser/Thr protein kinase)